MIFRWADIRTLIRIKDGKRVKSIVIFLLFLFSEDYIQAHALIEDCLDFKDSNKKYWKLKGDSVCMYVRSPLKAVLVLHHLTGTTLKRQKHVLSWNVTRRQWRRPMSNKEWRCALWYVAMTFNHEKCPNVHKLQHNIVCLKLTPNFSVIKILMACSIFKILIA